jgi:hypothetical protein
MRTVLSGQQARFSDLDPELAVWRFDEILLSELTTAYRFGIRA